MKALTLWQPWASLVALGVKTIETRSWSTKYRGPLAIHAARKLPSSSLRVGDYSVRGFGRTGVALVGPNLPELRMSPRAEGYFPPFGAIVATCDLIDCVPTGSLFRVGDNAMSGEVNWSQMRATDPDIPRDWETMVREREVPYGDYSPGRFAWLLDKIEPVDKSVPMKGHQGLWEWTP